MSTWKCQRDTRGSLAARNFSGGNAFDGQTLRLAEARGYTPDPRVHQRVVRSERLEVRRDGATGRVVSATAW